MSALDTLTVESPFGASDWDGGTVSLGGADATMPDAGDVVDVFAQGSSGDRWDGYTAAILRLRDGRYMGWTSSYGPTGSGFNRDAYGGDAVVYFAHDLDRLVWEGLDAEGRHLCGYPEQRPEVTHAE